MWVFHASSIKALDVGKLEVTLGAAEGFISEWFIPSVGYFMRLQHIFTDLRSLKFACSILFPQQQTVVLLKCEEISQIDGQCFEIDRSR